MPIFRLNRTLVFPPPDMAEPDGLLAVGGTLSTDRLLLAYRSGIFPWYDDQSPILWWSPDPRFVLLPTEFHVSHSLRRMLKSGRFEVTIDRDFKSVIHHCRTRPRPGQDGTWITAAMEQAYQRLHAAGHAHSVETWHEGRLAGGLYGVTVGRCFCGESMFTLEPDAGKVALARLVEVMLQREGTLIDCQVPTDHFRRMGARDMPRTEFLTLLQQAVGGPPCFP
ncbi:MAG: leucyl/phenylalanyl-tRNA--protein transferase [Lentisphaerae bacterium RIFOXYC12_FULL_60_16]|nr:MAG: leucyl/phenylalanyl-tRNA--protein transferase [Lentisphaerae bacterium RIFOXYC12_FULL_60_16]OGV85730.1 MAG: leucyl/phenylalanyl-tRNA--protein transferase [Lentisphaerae bacterium RIFOXYB12_FULL_60_10]